MTHPGSDVQPLGPRPNGYGFLGPEPAAAPGRGKKGRLGSAALRLLVVIAAGLAALVVRIVLAGLDDPAVGDCAKATGSTAFEIVECGTAEAQFRIVGVEEGTRTAAEIEAATDLCAGFPRAGIYLWEPGYKSAPGTVYCAEAI